ncbi:MAG: ABC transporter permease [Methanopyri archaeon]|jgi:hypothetical protein|nr:ABC transporter permease [Methanopyri archaeon]
MGTLRDLRALVALEHLHNRGERSLVSLGAVLLVLGALAALPMVVGRGPLLSQERFAVIVLADGPSAFEEMLVRDGRFTVHRSPGRPLEGVSLGSYDAAIRIRAELDAAAFSRDLTIGMKLAERPSSIPLVSAVRELAARYSEGVLRASLKVHGLDDSDAAPPSRLVVEPSRALGSPGGPGSPLTSARDVLGAPSLGDTLRAAANDVKVDDSTPLDEIGAEVPAGALDRLHEQLATGTEGADDSGLPWETTPLRRYLVPTLLLLPAFVLSSALSQSVAREKARRSGEVLLSCPVSPALVLIAKTVYYIAPSLGVAALLLFFSSPGLGAGALATAALAVAGIHVLVFSMDLAIGVWFTRLSELMSAMVVVHMGLVMLIFVPAAAPAISPIHSLSPLTLLADVLEGVPVEGYRLAFALAIPGMLVIAALPLALVLFGGSALSGTPSLSEELAFTLWRSTVRHGRWTLYLAGFLSQAVGAAASLVAQLALMLMLFVFRSYVAFLVCLLAWVTIEEVSKVYVGWSLRQRPDLDVGGKRTIVTVCIISALGFWCFELVTKIVFLLPAISSAGGLIAVGTAGMLSGYMRLLALSSVAHIVLTSIAAIGVVQGTRQAVVGYIAASSLLHLAFNMWMLSSI